MQTITKNFYQFSFELNNHLDWLVKSLKSLQEAKDAVFAEGEPNKNALKTFLKAFHELNNIKSEVEQIIQAEVTFFDPDQDKKVSNLKNASEAVLNELKGHVQFLIDFLTKDNLVTEQEIDNKADLSQIIAAFGNFDLGALNSKQIRFKFVGSETTEEKTDEFQNVLNDAISASLGIISDKEIYSKYCLRFFEDIKNVLQENAAEELTTNKIFRFAPRDVNGVIILPEKEIVEKEITETQDEGFEVLGANESPQTNQSLGVVNGFEFIARDVVFELLNKRKEIEKITNTNQLDELTDVCKDLIDTYRRISGNPNTVFGFKSGEEQILYTFEQCLNELKGIIEEHQGTLEPDLNTQQKQQITNQLNDFVTALTEQKDSENIKIQLDEIINAINKISLVNANSVLTERELKDQESKDNQIKVVVENLLIALNSIADTVKIDRSADITSHVTVTKRVSDIEEIQAKVGQICNGLNKKIGAITQVTENTQLAIQEAFDKAKGEYYAQQLKNFSNEFIALRDGVVTFEAWATRLNLLKESLRSLFEDFPQADEDSIKKHAAELIESAYGILGKINPKDVQSTNEVKYFIRSLESLNEICCGLRASFTIALKNETLKLPNQGNEERTFAEWMNAVVEEIERNKIEVDDKVKQSMGEKQAISALSAELKNIEAILKPDENSQKFATFITAIEALTNQIENQAQATVTIEDSQNIEAFRVQITACEEFIRSKLTEVTGDEKDGIKAAAARKSLIKLVSTLKTTVEKSLKEKQPDGQDNELRKNLITSLDVLYNELLLLKTHAEFQDEIAKENAIIAKISDLLAHAYNISNQDKLVELSNNIDRLSSNIDKLNVQAIEHKKQETIDSLNAVLGALLAKFEDTKQFDTELKKSKITDHIQTLKAAQSVVEVIEKKFKDLGVANKDPITNISDFIVKLEQRKVELENDKEVISALNTFLAQFQSTTAAEVPALNKELNEFAVKLAQFEMPINHEHNRVKTLIQGIADHFNAVVAKFNLRDVGKQINNEFIQAQNKFVEGFHQVVTRLNVRDVDISLSIYQVGKYNNITRSTKSISSNINASASDNTVENETAETTSTTEVMEQQIVVKSAEPNKLRNNLQTLGVSASAIGSAGMIVALGIAYYLFKSISPIFSEDALNFKKTFNTQTALLIGFTISAIFTAAGVAMLMGSMCIDTVNQSDQPGTSTINPKVDTAAQQTRVK